MPLQMHMRHDAASCCSELHCCWGWGAVKRVHCVVWCEYNGCQLCCGLGYQLWRWRRRRALLESMLCVTSACGTVPPVPAVLLFRLYVMLRCHCLAGVESQ